MGRNALADIPRAYLGLHLSSTTAVYWCLRACKSEHLRVTITIPLCRDWTNVSLSISSMLWVFVFISSSLMMCVTGVSSMEFEERDHFLVLIPHLTYTY